MQPSPSSAYILATLLRRGECWDLISRVLSLLGLLLVLLPLLHWPWSWQGIVTGYLLLLAGMLQTYWAQRVALDAELFSYWSKHAANSEELVYQTAQLDCGLASLGLRSAELKASWEQRAKGALTLLKYQLISLLAQILLMLLGTMLATMTN